MSDFSNWFNITTKTNQRPGVLPHQWQVELASDSHCTNRLIRIPTGMGKTLGVLLTWAFHRVQQANPNWPRRLIWCLPMRTLVEQTYAEANKIISQAGIELDAEAYMLMGGVDQADWHIHPERPAILIGTQDMLLSRALNRGYASGRARWPVDYGLLNHDALWVMDEVQLMDVGLATSAQLQAFRDQDRDKALRPCVTWWMSATLQTDWLKTVDTESYHADWTKVICAIPAPQMTGGLWDIHKACFTESIEAKKANEFAKRILAAHAESTPGDYGKITLVVCNTVDRAIESFNELKKAGRTVGIELVHSRFRPAERELWRERFLTRESCKPDVDRIIVATQVVEAGVDISATCLITELAPWPSLVQRFGRCARYGGSGQVIVVDRGHDEKTSLPYPLQELESAWNSIQTLNDVGVKAIEVFEQSLTAEARATLYPFTPDHLLLRNEFDELFDTTPDLTGADLDISRFIRSGVERDVQVFWRSLAADEAPSDDLQPHRRELCSVPFLKARDWLCGAETKTDRKPKMRAGMRAWIWDWIDGQWVQPRHENLLPGRVVIVDSACGGYEPTSGFDPESKKSVPPVLDSDATPVDQSTQADNREDGEDLSFNPWKSIACHSHEVVQEVMQIADHIELPAELRTILRLAAIWHDIGKSHPAFQGSIRHADRPRRDDLAKGPDDSWLKPRGTYRFADDSDNRPGFRHELASALAMFALLENYNPNHPALLGSWSEVFDVMGTGLTAKEPGSDAFSGQKTKPKTTVRNPKNGSDRSDLLKSDESIDRSMNVCRHTVNLAAETESIPKAVQEILDCSAEAFDLLVYLIASHHGKVRAALHASPKDQQYRDHDDRGLPIRGVREGDRLPSLCLDDLTEQIPELSLTLEPATLGLSIRTGASWRERCLGLLDRHGPTTLAYLESILRAADVRASQLKTGDPALAEAMKVES